MVISVRTCAREGAARLRRIHRYWCNGWRWARSLKQPPSSRSTARWRRRRLRFPRAQPSSRGVSRTEFWCRADRTWGVEAVGSQLLWAAAESNATPTRSGGGTHSSTSDKVTPLRCARRRLVESALKFCRKNGATYRPHPSEKRQRVPPMLGRLPPGGDHGRHHVGARSLSWTVPSSASSPPACSRPPHAVATRGSTSPVPLRGSESSGSATRCSRLGSCPTPAPARPDREPARRIAEIVTEAVVMISVRDPGPRWLQGCAAQEPPRRRGQAPDRLDDRAGPRGGRTSTCWSPRTTRRSPRSRERPAPACRGCARPSWPRTPRRPSPWCVTPSIR